MELDRAMARLMGWPTYTGRPCTSCGSTTRETRRALCPPCTRAKAITYARANPEPRDSKRARAKAWKDANLDKVRMERRRRRARDLGVTLEALDLIDTAEAARRAEVRERREIEAAAIATRKAERQAAALLKRAEADLLKAERYEARRAFLRVDPKGLTRRQRARRYKAVRNALRREPDATTVEAERVMLTLQRGRCAYCGEPGPLHLDHKHPISKGGHHEWRNLQWLCGPHNMSKRATPDADFRKRHGIPARTPWDWTTGLLLIAAEP